MIKSHFHYKKLISVIIIVLLAGFCNGGCQAQEKPENEENNFHPHSEIALVISHAEVFQGRNEAGDKQVLSLPSWGINYNYWFRPKWAIGLHTDLIVEKYEVKKTSSDGTSETIERSYPIAPALMGIFKPTKHWAFELGMGAEFSSEENFMLTRAGIEYSAEFPKEWEAFGTLSYDFKWNAYDTWVIGIGISKRFGK